MYPGHAQRTNLAAFSLAFFLIGVSACGSTEGDTRNAGEVALDRAPGPAPADTCANDPQLPACERTPGDGEDNGSHASTDGDGRDASELSIEDVLLARAAVENILLANCGSCHGPVLNVAEASAGLNYINDVDRLSRASYVVALDSAASPIVRMMRSGEMPPPDAGLPRVSDAEIDAVARYIDAPESWSLPTVARLCPEQRISIDDVYATVAADLARLDAPAARRARYVSFANLANTGTCISGAAFDFAVQGLSKVLNMLSASAALVVPVAVDPDRTLFRIDLGDYAWNEPVTVENADGTGAGFADKWEAVLANNSYAVPYVGADASVASDRSGSAVPMMLADSLIDTAMRGPLYYALLGVDTTQSLDAFIADDLAVDVVRNIQDGLQVRAGTTRSLVAPYDRIIERDPLGARPGALWQTLSTEDGAGRLFDAPFDFGRGGREAIFTLPNGLFGYVLADPEGAIVSELSLVIRSETRAISTPVSCSNCHWNGLVPVVDEVREALLGAGSLSLGELEQVERTFPDAAELAGIFEADNAAYTRASSQVNVSPELPDPVAWAFFRFAEDVTLADAAGDLGLTQAALRSALPRLDPSLRALGTGQITREAFTQLYVAASCALSAGAINQPDPRVCASSAP